MKTTVIHGQEPEPSTSKDLKTEETVTLDDETWELMKSVKNHVGQEDTLAYITGLAI